MRPTMLLTAVLPTLLCTHAATVLAWGSRGHGAIGQAAMQLLGEQARAAVVSLLGDDSEATVSAACNWPDQLKETAEGKWSLPLHYVNIPRSVEHYDQQRDCDDGLCITEAIRRYAEELSRRELDTQRRWQAFAWVCHLVADLHQPLHAGYRDDLGGGLVSVTYRGETDDLHEFWDSMLIRQYLAEGVDLMTVATPRRCDSASRPWNPDSVDEWTDESHALVASSAYPPSNVIDEDFEARSWPIVEARLQLASCRLATVLNGVLGSSGVETGR